MSRGRKKSLRWCWCWRGSWSSVFVFHRGRRCSNANWNITIHLSSIFSKSGHGMTSLSNLPTLASWTIGVYVEDELEVGSSYEECFISIASERKEQENCSGIWTANWLWSARRAGSNRSRIWWDWTNLVYAFKHKASNSYASNSYIHMLMQATNFTLV